MITDSLLRMPVHPECKSIAGGKQAIQRRTVKVAMKTTIPMKNLEERNASPVGGLDGLLLARDMVVLEVTVTHRHSLCHRGGRGRSHSYDSPTSMDVILIPTSSGPVWNIGHCSLQCPSRH